MTIAEPLLYADGGSGYYFSTEPGFSDGDSYVPQNPASPTPAAPVPIVTAAPAPVAASAATPKVFVVAVPVPIPTPHAAPTVLPVPEVQGTPRYRASDYADAARALLPRGRVWSTDPDSVQGRMLLAIGATFERSDAALSAILGGSLPGSLSPMLPEWEAALGLPDPCAGAAPTIAQRLDQVRARFVGIGGQGRQHFIDFAAALGFTISITNYAPFRAGRSTAGQPVSSDAWRFVWAVRVLATSGSLPSSVLICELNALKPAETTILDLNAPFPVLLAPDGTPIVAPDGNVMTGPIN